MTCSGRHFRTGIGGFPGIQRTAPAHPGRFRPSAIQRVKAIHQQGSGGFRPCQNIKRQQKDLGIPEDVTVIVVAGQRAGADGHALIGWVGCAVQVVQGEPQGKLRVRIAIDHHIAALATG